MVHFQPIWNIQTAAFKDLKLSQDCRSKGGNDLAGFVHSDRRENHLIGRLGEIIMVKALAEARFWPSSVRISVNISPAQMTAKRRLSAMVDQAIAETGIDAARIDLEITESILLGQDDHVMIDLKALQAQGSGLLLMILVRAIQA